MTTWHLHPPPVAFDPADAPLVRAEAERQFDCWCVFVGREDAERRIAVIEAGLLQMLKCGNARVRGGRVLAWHPTMDDELNRLYIDHHRRPDCYQLER